MKRLHKVRAGSATPPATDDEDNDGGGNCTVGGVVDDDGDVESCGVVPVNTVVASSARVGAGVGGVCSLEVKIVIPDFTENRTHAVGTDGAVKSQHDGFGAQRCGEFD